MTTQLTFAIGQTETKATFALSMIEVDGVLSAFVYGSYGYGSCVVWKHAIWDGLSWSARDVRKRWKKVDDA